MATIRSRLTRARGRLAALLAVTLLLRLLVPSGFMPVASAQGIAIVACDGSGPATMPGMAHHHGDAAKHATICDFAALGWGMAGAAAAAVPPPVPPSFSPPRPAIAAALALTAADRLRPPLRAPPLA